MAVYTEVPYDELAAFLRAYDIGDVVSFKGIAEGVENSNYLLDTTQGRFILTLYEKRVRPDDLPFFLGLLEHLSANGHPRAHIRSSRDQGRRSARSRGKRGWRRGHRPCGRG
ncbi:phosphotransferase, partial [Hansschlegelia beijingensis]